MNNPRVTATTTPAFVPQRFRLPLALSAVLMVIFGFTFFFTPESKLNWVLEVGPGLAGMVALAVTARRFPMSRFVYLAVFLHILVLVYGGFYTYAKAPLGEWIRQAFDLHRNNYDKVGHFSFGLLVGAVALLAVRRQSRRR